MAKEYAPTISLRVTFAERAQLEHLAKGAPVSTYIKSQLLTPDAPPPPPKRVRAPVKDHQALARVTALLGQSHINANINQLAKQANMGTLPVTPETEAALKYAVQHIADMRELLIQALGLGFEP